MVDIPADLVAAFEDELDEYMSEWEQSLRKHVEVGDETPPSPDEMIGGRLIGGNLATGQGGGGPRVAVVGAGPGGLFAAYHLNQLLPDATVTIFEATGRVGGKLLSAEFEDGSPFEAGVAEFYEYLGPGGRDPMRDLIENELGLTTKDMAGGCVVLDGKVVRDLDELQAQFGRETREQVERFHARCAELMPLDKFAKQWQIDNDDPWATEPFDESLDREVTDPMARRYVEVAVHSDLATSPHNCNGLNGIKNVLLDNDKYMRLYHVTDGMERVAERLAGRASAKWRLNTRVIAVRKRKDDYQVVTDSGADEFDYVVVCLPNHILPSVDFGETTLADAVAEMLAHYDLPAHYLRVTFRFSEPWWTRWSIPGDFWMVDGHGGLCVYDEYRRWGRGNVLSFLLGGVEAMAQQSQNQSDDQVFDACLSVLPPDMRQLARDMFVDGRVDRYLGAINAQPGGWPAAELRGEHQPDPEGHPGVFLCGDYLIDSTVNAAMISSRIAAELLAEVAGRPVDKKEV